MTVDDALAAHREHEEARAEALAKNAGVTDRLAAAITGMLDATDRLTPQEHKQYTERIKS